MITIQIFKKRGRSLAKIGATISDMGLSFAHVWVGAPKEHITVTSSREKILSILESIK